LKIVINIVSLLFNNKTTMNKLVKTESYGLSFPTLVQVGGQMVDNMYRDKNEFETIGVSVSRIDALKEMLDDFRKISTDEGFKFKLAELSKSKASLIALLVNQIDTATIIVDAAYGYKSNASKNFGFANSADKKKQKLVLERAYKAISFARETTELLLPAKFNELIPAIEATAAQIEAIELQLSTLKTSRKNLSNRRIETANEIYKELSALCRLGKRIWMGRNIAYYENYVIGTKQRKVNVEPKTLAA